MPKANLSGMTVEALMDLRKRVDEMLHKRRADIERQLARMDIAAVGGARVARRGGSVLKEKKSRRNIAVPPAKLGLAVAQNLVGLLLPSKMERSSTIS